MAEGDYIPDLRAPGPEFLLLHLSGSPYPPLSIAEAPSPASLQASVQLGICSAGKCSGQSVPVVQRQGGPLGVTC